ncbi:DUF4254 domain-containing protein [Nocardia otitidiscaviarum]|uniref:DUF4254 domain-containing protein n=1 Tax=Nocardia otitidiscaviarum TaxID=1823 RepID=UPI0006949717|nr:DUF4254 domain-containing protein [Nocardia otitidiscaviarum]MBF6136625.1 DUF4254 domain-containing protein [Nocardia otitidiscaviarum]MBF6484827.1 DUF4254 domain-containing protein [Nocardia otitidiscaviarum]
MCLLDQRRARPLLVEGSRAATNRFPSKDELLEAFHRSDRYENPLADFATRLADLHRRRQQYPQRSDEIDRQRGELVTVIDCWVATNTPPPHPRARMHTETVGTLIDRMAATAATAFRVLMTEHPGSDTVHAAWTRLAELENAYSDLTDDLARGWRRLPHTECDTTERSLTE